MAIHYLHSQAPPIVHRDLKVENLLLGQDNRFKLCDFGSCCVCEAPVVCHDKHHRTAVEDDISKHSTLAYRAPEQVDLYLQKPISEKVDVWALGILLFKLTVGRTPFEDPAGNVEKMGILNARIRFPEPYQLRIDCPHFPLQLRWSIAVSFWWLTCQLCLRCAPKTGTALFCRSLFTTCCNPSLLPARPHTIRSSGPLSLHRKVDCRHGRLPSCPLLPRTAKRAESLPLTSCHRRRIRIRRCAAQARLQQATRYLPATPC